MNNELTNSATAEKPPRVVEVIAPPGAGKTTLIKALSQRHKDIRSGIHLSKARRIPFFIGNTFSLLPTFLSRDRHGRWFNRRETRSMEYLKAWLHVLGRQASSHDRVTLLDHGPIYRLAQLREFGPEITTSQTFKRWWASVLNQWSSTLDTLVWLDAPDAILLKRIHARDSWHTIKDKTEQEALDFLTHHRAALTQIITESVSGRQVKLLRFDTHRESVGQIVEKILPAFDLRT